MALNRILADRLSWTARGERLTKAQVIADYLEGNLHFTSFSHDNVTVGIFGNTAVMAGHSTSVLEYKSKLFDAPRLFTDVYVKTNGRWQLVVHHFSELAKPAVSVANKGESPVDESVLSANKALIRRLFEEEINQKNLTAMESMVADGYVSHNDSLGPPSDIKQTEKFLAAVFAAFPDAHVTIEDMIAEGDRVVVRNTWRGTFRGPWMGIPPTGKEVTWTGIVMWKVNNGKITDRWANINFNEVLQRLANDPSKVHEARR